MAGARGRSRDAYRTTAERRLRGGRGRLHSHPDTELAERFELSTRTLERLVSRGLGVSPKWLLDCWGLQEAATRLFREPDIDLAGLAADLGYADQAHFTRHYHRVLGERPDATRRAGRDPRSSH
ncbi:hypothetical protein BHE97_00365 [Aeromicrobium sp. PE09-221]|uniref:helix-turn-helix domain-containing protein n=1 Tax=Aeromicrobium sp. PE09-221 TaxID=1898043 RepID=UPI000B696B08|nr:helix-turn-helix domain-containing protein [Aeromicrobium sp. PE09-221]OUZ12704.1 hypothetical protein BHE97_00365 [Aeromicrobium sp. PE09-221]